MKYLATLLLSGFCLPALAQQRQFDVRSLSLPKELEYYDNQFSGLYIAQSQLYLLSESRLQDRAEAKLYTVQLADLTRQLADTTYALPYQKLPITGLPALRAQMTAAGQRYEGHQQQGHQTFAAATVLALGVVAAQQGYVALIAFVGEVKHVAY